MTPAIGAARTPGLDVRALGANPGKTQLFRQRSRSWASGAGAQRAEVARMTRVAPVTEPTRAMRPQCSRRSPARSDCQRDRVFANPQLDS